jgi:UPF0716 protein FxsA
VLLVGLFVAFVVLPLAELYVIIQVAHVIGGWETIALLLAESIFGAWLMKREGRGVLRRIQTQLTAGRMPGRELADGALILFAGALMLTPGFLTDVVGFLLLFPPTRSLARLVLMKRMKRHLGTGYQFLGDAGGGRFASFGFGADVVDTTGRERVRQGELGPGPPVARR